MWTYHSSLTASAIIASTTTSAIAEPRFCTVNKSMKCHWELLNVAFRPRISHGTRESTLAITRYGILFLPLIGIQSDKILQARCKLSFQKYTEQQCTRKKITLFHFHQLQKSHKSTAMQFVLHIQLLFWISYCYPVRQLPRFNDPADNFTIKMNISTPNFFLFFFFILFSSPKLQHRPIKTIE